MTKTVLLAGLYHETNTFLRNLTALEHFSVRVGNDILRADGDGSPLAGALSVARERNWKVLPVIEMRAAASGTVADEVIERFWDAVERARDRGWMVRADGVYLVLHGAMVSQTSCDVEGDLLLRLRRLPELSEKPLCGVLDLHANFTEAMASGSDGLIAYRENPHADAHATAADAARLLDGLMEDSKRAVTVREQPRILWPPSRTGTADGPMAALESQARALEREHEEILALNVFAGFPFADVPAAGVCFSAVTTGDPREALKAVRQLAVLAWELRDEGREQRLLTLDEAVLKAEGDLEEEGTGPVLLVEPSDNIGAGAPGENTHLLKAFVKHGVRDAGVVINDPEVVRTLTGAEAGACTTVCLGGKTGELGSEALELHVEIVQFTDGKFTLEDENSHLAARGGRNVDMGPCALVRHEGVLILLTSRSTPPFDLGQWRSVGVNPESLDIVGVKAGAGYRRAYDSIARSTYLVDLPGPCAENLGQLPYRLIRRPIHPLDQQSQSKW
jgi:microcystin degradation protein MlrC